MKYFVKHANRRTLVLIDEFGTGSDPELGGAIAEVILEELARKKAFGIVTTHYRVTELQSYRVTELQSHALRSSHWRIDMHVLRDSIPDKSLDVVDPQLHHHILSMLDDGLFAPSEHLADLSTSEPLHGDVVHNNLL